MITNNNPFVDEFRKQIERLSMIHGQSNFQNKDSVDVQDREYLLYEKESFSLNPVIPKTTIQLLKQNSLHVISDRSPMF